MRLAVRHRTAYAYAPAALKLALRLRLWPARFESQRVERWSVAVNGEPVAPLLTDGFGDAVGLWHAHRPLERAEVIAEGVVETADASGLVRGLARGRAQGVFLRDTPLTEPDAAIRALAESARDEAVAGAGMLGLMHDLMAAVRGALEFRAGATDSTTPAARALALGAGVCQDHAHVFLACARALGVPARYVAGYLLASDDEAELHETHGWTEVWLEDLGWVGFDPSNGVCPTERYIRLAAGLDAHGAAPLRGSVTGRAEETLEADVAIAPAAAAQQQ